MQRGPKLLRRSAVAAVLLAGAAACSAPSAQAATSAVVDGNARFQILTPTLIRLEYAGDGRFEDRPTYNAVKRDWPAAAYTTSITADGHREIRTSGMVLRYRRGSGPFAPGNTTVQLTTGGQAVTGRPEFPSHCPAGTVCEAENALLGGYAATNYDHANHTGTGFVAGLSRPQSMITHHVAVPSAGTYSLQVRYANHRGGDGQLTTRTMSTAVNGSAGPRLSMAPTSGWDSWSVVTVPVTLRAGVNVVRLVTQDGDAAHVNIDGFAVTSGGGYPAASALETTGYGAGPRSRLGGWIRSLDNVPTVPTVEHPGLLNRGGWYLLDDSRTALLAADGTVSARPSRGSAAYQDGFLFAYGRDYKRALRDLNELTGPSAFLPRSAYGVWYSRYWAYSDADYRNTLIPAFRRHQTPIDWLVIDTDFKAPSPWNGWNWNTSLFPDPKGFMEWTKQQGLSVSLNIHPSIERSDPQFAGADQRAAGLIHDRDERYAWDWARPGHVESYMDLHRPFEDLGVRTWWLDYCTTCGASTYSNQQLAPDSFINGVYARDGDAKGVRGFAFSRIGGSEQAAVPGTYPSGPWSERRQTLHFTGDTPGTWEMVGYAAELTASEGATGLSNVSHDIGSFHGDHLADDLYARWVQLGTFQPITRLHSDHADRLPWEYSGKAQWTAEKFLRLRQALVPYTYTLARRAHDTGVPIVRAMYLEHPNHAEAYTHRQQYFFGDDVLVAPITSPDGADGRASKAVWFPPGSWVDVETGQTFTGPSTATVTKDTSHMPVFLRSGGVMVRRTDYVERQDEKPLNELTVDVAAGASGSFELYEDAGEGHGYRSGQSARTRIAWNEGDRTLTVGAAQGGFPGLVGARGYTLRLHATAAPTSVTVDGGRVPETAWSYNQFRRTVTVWTPRLSTSAAHTVRLVGSAASNPAGGAVVGNGGRCLDVDGGVSENGRKVQLWDCNGSAAQNWEHRGDGSLRALGRCLDVSGGATGNGIPVQLFDCNGTAAQVWVTSTDGTLRNPGSGRCLDAQGGRTSNGTPVQLWDCHDVAAMNWRLPPGPVVGPGGKCADVLDADPASGTPIVLFGCNGSDAQRWSVPGDGTVRAFGKCLDVVGGVTANNTAVQLWDCNGTPAQQWVSGPGPTLRHQASGRCLDDPENRQSDGDKLRIHDCNGTAAQEWRLP